MAEHGSKLNQIRALREARIRAAERAAPVSETNKKPGAESSAVTDPVRDE